MKVLVSGASGLIGSALVRCLEREGHRIVRLVRQTDRSSSEVAGIGWDPVAGLLAAAALEGFDAVVHLAGENIARRRWTAARKRAIRDSRVLGTRLLSERLAQARQRPRVLICASAIGYYGDRGEEELDEEAESGEGFLARVVREWEAAATAVAAAGLRVVLARFGLVLSPAGGALKSLLLPFRLGLGGRIGSGSQYWSWIALDDAVGAICHALDQEALAGPVNFVAPQPVANAEFAKILGQVLRRPAWFPLPAWLARLTLGEMADALLLASARVRPARLLASGYRFLYPHLEEALRYLLGRQ